MRVANQLETLPCRFVADVLRTRCTCVNDALPGGIARNVKTEVFPVCIDHDVKTASFFLRKLEGQRVGVVGAVGFAFNVSFR